MADSSSSAARAPPPPPLEGEDGAPEGYDLAPSFPHGSVERRSTSYPSGGPLPPGFLEQHEPSTLSQQQQQQTMMTPPYGHAPPVYSQSRSTLPPLYSDPRTTSYGGPAPPLPPPPPYSNFDGRYAHPRAPPPGAPSSNGTEHATRSQHDKLYMDMIELRKTINFDLEKQEHELRKVREENAALIHAQQQIRKHAEEEIFNATRMLREAQEDFQRKLALVHTQHAPPPPPPPPPPSAAHASSSHSCGAASCGA
jgi:hypothetical protein